MDGGFGDDVGVETVAQVDRVDVVTANEGAHVSDLQSKARSLTESLTQASPRGKKIAHHSRSLYMMVKNTWRKRLTALINTANR